jgi:hypothetical protein
MDGGCGVVSGEMCCCRGGARERGPGLAREALGSRVC